MRTLATIYEINRSQFEAGEVSPERFNRALQYIRSNEKIRTEISYLGVSYQNILKDVERAVRYAKKNKAWRAYYGKIYSSSLVNILNQLSQNGSGTGDLELRVEPKLEKSLNPITRKVDEFLKFNFPVKGDTENGKTATIESSLWMPNSEHLARYRPSEVMNASMETLKHFPTEAFLFYGASLIVSSGTQLIHPSENPHAFQDALGMYFNKKTILDVPELANLFTFLAGAKIGSRMFDITSMKAGATHTTRMLLEPVKGYFGLAFASLSSSLIADGFTTLKNCSLGYFTNGKNFLSSKEQLEHIENCDLAYDQWVRGKAAYKYFGETMRLLAAAGASSASSLALRYAANNIKGVKAVHAQLKASLSAAGKVIDRVVISGIDMTGFVSNATAAATPSPTLKIVGWTGRVASLVAFMTWDRVVESLIMTPYQSWDLAGEADASEERLLKDFQNFTTRGGVIENTPSADSCGNLFQRMTGVGIPARLRNTPEGLKCYDGTVFQALDNYATDQKSWRDLMLHKMNASYVAWTDQTLQLINKFSDTEYFYEMFLEQVNSQSSAVFGDSNPYVGMRGIVAKEPDKASADKDSEVKKEDSGIEFVNDGTLPIDEMKIAQKQNLDIQNAVIANWIRQLENPQEPASRKINNTDINMLISELKSIQRGLSSNKFQPTRAAFQRIWELADHYNDYCISLNEERSPYCYFGDLRARFGNVLPGSVLNSHIWLNAASQALREDGSPPDLYPGEFKGIPTPDSAHYLLATMACGADLIERSSVWDLFRFVRNTSERGWELSFGTHPNSSIEDRFGFKMDFLPPALVANDYRKDFCSNQYLKQTTSPKPLSFEQFSWNMNGKSYPSLADLVARNISPIFLASNGNDTKKAFHDWWVMYVERFYNDAIDEAQINYQKIIRKEMLPAIYGYREYLDKKNPFKDCAKTEPRHDENEVNLIIPSVADIAMDSSPKMVEDINQGKFIHMYPPKYPTAEDIKGCLVERHKYLPIVSAVRLEFELYLDQLLKPLFLQMFASDDAYKNDKEKLARVERLFNKNRKWILNSLEMLLRYEPNINGTVNAPNAPAPEGQSWLILNMAYLALNMGAPIDPGIIKAILQYDRQIKFMHPDLGAFPFEEWQIRQELLEKARKSVVFKKMEMPIFDLLEEMPKLGPEEDESRQILTPPWANLTEDQRQFVQAVFEKMTAVAVELGTYKRIVEDIKFTLETQ